MNLETRIRNIPYLPALSSYKIKLDGKTITQEIANIDINSSKTFSLVMEIVGLNYILKHSSNPLFINFCVYETNYSTGKGYRIIKFYNMLLSEIAENSSSQVIDFELLTIDKKSVPMEGGFEGDRKTPYYDFIKAFLSVKIFFSIEDFSTIEDIDNLFYSLNNVMLDTKLPFRQFKND